METPELCEAFETARYNWHVSHREEEAAERALKVATEKNDAAFLAFEAAKRALIEANTPRPAQPFGPSRTWVH